MINREVLNELTKVIDYKWRKGPGGKQLAYIDARQAMGLLDSVLGPENWQCDYKEVSGNVYCGIGIFIGERWVWKWDCGSESKIEAEKGESSDAFKRAAVRWGVGRFLYSLDDKNANKNSYQRPKSRQSISPPPRNKTRAELVDEINAQCQLLVTYYSPDVIDQRCTTMTGFNLENVDKAPMDKTKQFHAYVLDAWSKIEKKAGAA